MDVMKQYAIAWKGLKNGTYRFDFKVDNALFEAYGSTDIKDGDPDRFRTLFIAKNRRGVCGEIDFLFDGAHQHFTQLNTDWQTIEVDGQPAAIKMDRKLAAQEQDPNEWHDVELNQIPFPEFQQGGKHVQNRT